MGIQGLTALVRQQLGVSAASRAAPGCPVVVDSNGLVHYAVPAADWTAGSHYAALARIARAWARALAAAAGSPSCITFVFDGALPNSKRSTRRLRIARRIDAIRSIAAYACQEAAAPARPPAKRAKASAVSVHAQMQGSASAIIPPFAIPCFIAALRLAGFNICISLDIEADLCIARIAHSTNAVVISRDSDFYVFDVPLFVQAEQALPCPSLGIHPLGPSIKLQLPHSHTGFTCHDVATAFNINPLHMPLLAVLASYDHSLASDIDDILITHSFNTYSKKWNRIFVFLRPLRTMSVDEAMLALSDSLAKSAPLKEKLLAAFKLSVAQYECRPEASEAQLLSSLSQSHAPESNSTSALAPVPSTAATLVPSAAATPVSRQSPEPILDTILESSDGPKLAQSVICKIERLVKESVFDFKVLEIACMQELWCLPFLQDDRKESSWLLSRCIRACMYGVLGFKPEDTITEQVWVSNSVAEHHVKPLPVQHGPEDWTKVSTVVDCWQLIPQMITPHISLPFKDFDYRLWPLILAVSFITRKRQENGDAVGDHELLAWVCAGVVSLHISQIASEMDHQHDSTTKTSKPSSTNQQESQERVCITRKSLQNAAELESTLFSIMLLFQSVVTRSSVLDHESLDVDTINDVSSTSSKQGKVSDVMRSVLEHNLAFWECVHGPTFHRSEEMARRGTDVSCMVSTLLEACGRPQPSSTSAVIGMISEQTPSNGDGEIDKLVAVVLRITEIVDCRGDGGDKA